MPGPVKKTAEGYPYQEPASFLQKIASTTPKDIEAARAPARETKGIGTNIADQFIAGWDQMKGALPGQGVDKQPPTNAINVAGGALKMAASPIMGTLDTAGQQAEKVTGGFIKSEDVTDAVGMIGAAKAPAAAVTGASAARNAMGVIEKIFSPETVNADAKLAVNTIREAGGKAARATATTETQLEPAWKTVNAMPTGERMNFLDYVEGRSGQYAGLQMRDAKLQTLANTLRGIFDERMQKLQALPSTAQAQFIADYFPHFWKDPAKAGQAVQQSTGGFGKQGSGASLKKREIPTYADGIAMGLEPLYTNPLEGTLRYIASMDKFIAATEVLDTAKNAGIIKYVKPKTMGASGHPESYKVPDGYAPLEGRGSTNAAGAKAFAPDGWARIYNNFISRGIAEVGEEYGKAYETLRRGSNAITAMELGLSGYHSLTMMQESIVNSVANAVGYARKGKPVEAVKSLGRAVVAPVQRAREGKKIQNIYLGISPGSQHMREVTELLTEAGGRAKGARHAADYEFSNKGSYITTLKRSADKLKTVAEGFKSAGAQIKASPIVGTAKLGAEHIGRILETVAAPIFQTYIPLMKNGAFYENMSAWMKTHPGAIHEEQLNAARQIWDSIDNRFGELVQDNIFINKLMKQMAMLSLRSWSWFVGGDIRELGGGVRDFMRAPIKRPTGTGPNEGRWTQKMDYALALPITYGTLSALYQFVKTGEAPESVQDLLAPRTGGTDPATGQPERLLIPGYMKDVFGFAMHPVDEMTAKAASAPTKVKELITNKDWRGDPIVGPKQGDENTAPQWLQAYWRYAQQNFGPITLRSAMKGPKTGTNLSAPEQMLGVRTAPRYLTDPEGYEKMMERLGKRDWRKKLIHDKSEQKLYE